MHFRASLWLSLFSFSAAIESAAGGNDSDVRAAIARSLPFLEEKGVAWIRDRGCVTCHQTTFLIWTHNEARRRGFAVDRRKINEWTNWALLQSISLSDIPRDDSDDNNSADTLAQLLLGRDPESPWFNKPPQWYGRMADPYENVLNHLLKAQAADGRWRSGGQSDNPAEIPTAWAVLALASRDEFVNATGPAAESRRAIQPALKRLVEPNNDATPKARDKALAWLRAAKPGNPDDLNEQWVLRLLIERKFGKPIYADKRLKELLALQKTDGGWSADPKLRQPSDAFATGQSLYALRLPGGPESPRLPAQNPATRRLMVRSHDSVPSIDRKEGSRRQDRRRFHLLGDCLGDAWIAGDLA